MGEAQSPKNTASAATVSAAFGQLWETHPAAVVASAIVLLAAGALAGWLLVKITIGGTGDEPPIRVRGGSVDIQLIGIEGWFIGDWSDKKDHWEVSEGKKGSLGVAIQTTGATCPPVFEDVKKVTFGFTPKASGQQAEPEISNFLTIDPGNSKTKISPKDAAVNTLTKHDGRLLTYPVTGFISSVTIQPATGTPQTFSFKEGEFKEAILF